MPINKIGRHKIYASLSDVSEMRFELTRANAHYPLKVACLPIPPPGHSKGYNNDCVDL